MLHHRRGQLVTGLLFLTLFIPILFLLFGIGDFGLFAFQSFIIVLAVIFANLSEIRQRKFNARDPYTYVSLFVLGINGLILLPFLPILAMVLLRPSELHLYLLAILFAGLVWNFLLKRYNPTFVLLPIILGNVLVLNSPRILKFFSADAVEIGYSFVVAISILVAQHTFFTSSSREEVIRVIVLSLICIFLPLILAIGMSY